MAEDNSPGPKPGDQSHIKFSEPALAGDRGH